MWLSAFACLGSAPWLSVCAGLGEHRDLCWDLLSASPCECVCPTEALCHFPSLETAWAPHAQSRFKDSDIMGNTDAVFLVWHQAELL